MAKAETVLGEAAGSLLLAQLAITALMQLGQHDLVAKIQQEAAAQAPGVFSEAERAGLDRDAIIDAAQARIRTIVVAAMTRLALNAKRPT